MKPHIARRLLKVSQHANHHDIKQAWKKQLIKHHPDHNKNSVHSLKYTRALLEARDTLLELENTDILHYKNDYYFYPFTSEQQEFIFWQLIIKGLDQDDTW